MDIKPVSIVSPLNEEEYNELLREAVAVIEAPLEKLVFYNWHDKWHDKF